MSSKNDTSANVGKSRKTRTNLEKRDADILCQILKTLEDGHVWKVIKEGVGTKQEMFLAWEKVTKLFNESTGKDLTRQQVRAFYQRIKSKKKEEADKKRLEEREFNRSCQKTGGGQGPSTLPEVDGDSDLNLDFDDIAPVDTNWNQFMGSKDDMENLPPVTESGRTIAPSPVLDKSRRGLPQPTTLPALMLPTGLRRVRYPVTYRSAGSSSILASVSTNTLQDRAIPSPVLVANSPPLTAGGSPAPARSAEGDMSVMEEIEVFTQDSHFSMAIEPPQQSKKVKKGKGGDLNNSAADYYSEMLKINKNLAEQKKELLKEKINTEKLKQKILREQLLNVNGKDLVMSDDDDDDNTSDDSPDKSLLEY